MRVLGVLRGRPGCGHVTPGLAVLEWCRAAGHQVAACTYGNGPALLAGDPRLEVFDLGIEGPYSAWAGMQLIDDVVLRLRPVVERWRPDVMLLGGEYLVPLEARRWGVPLLLLYNPEVFARAAHNLPYRDLFLESFGACQGLLAQAAPPAEDELWPESAGLVLRRTAYHGPLLRPLAGAAARAGGGGTLSVVVGNGGGSLLPGDTRTYGAGGSSGRDWLYQSYHFPVRVLQALAGRDDVEARAFLCLPGEQHREVQARFAAAPNVRVGGGSLGYHEALLGADLVVTRAGASSVSEILALRRPALLWPLAGHAEQERTVRTAQQEHDFVDGIWDEAEIEPLLARTLARLRGARPPQGADLNEAGMRRCVALVASLKA